MKFNYYSVFILLLVACHQRVPEQVNKKDFNEELVDLSNQLNPEQSFIVSPTSDTIIEGNKGTKIYIKPSSFQFTDGQPVTEPIELNLKEIYEVSEMILNNLSTTSNGELLESSGMVRLTATSNGKELELNSPIRIRFKKVTDAPYMRTFTGIQDSTGVNWLLDSNNQDTILFNEIGRIITPARDYSDSVVVTIIKTYGVIGFDTIELNRIEYYGPYDTTLSTTQQPYYELYSSKLNLINCDYFVDPDSIITVYVKSDNELETNDYLIFKDINSIMPSNYNIDFNEAFYNVPHNSEVTILSFGKSDSSYYLATKNKVLTNNNDTVRLEYKLLSLQELNNELKELNKNWEKEANSR